MRFTTLVASNTLCRGVTVLIIKCRNEEIKSLHTVFKFVAENHLTEQRSLSEKLEVRGES